VGPACTVQVVPPPEEGRPVSYIGAIGSNLTIEASLDTQTCKVGDPLKLTLSIGGNTRLENISPPPLNLQTNLTQNFRIYEDTVQSGLKDGKRTYTYTLRPVTAGTLELPPIEAAYFDSAKRKYHTIKSLPIPIRANESAEIGAGNIIETVANKMSEARRLTEQDSAVVAPIDIDPAGAKSQALALETWETAVLVVLPLLYFVVLVLKLAGRHFATASRSRERLLLIENALSLLAESRKTRPSDASPKICKAIRRYLAARFGASEAGITPVDARTLLENNGVDKELISHLCDILERNFNSAYSGIQAGSAAPEADRDKAITAIRHIEDFVTRKRTARNEDHHSSAAGTLGTVLVLSTFSCYTLFADVMRSDGGSQPEETEVAEHTFMWNEANARVASASTEQDFLSAASTYRKLADAGVKNGHLFYNIGTALLKAKRYDEAIEAFLQAERYSGSSEDISRNMRIALAAKNKDPNATLPWYRVPLFWHYNLSIFARIRIAVCAFAGFWLALLLRTAGSNRIYKPLLACSIILFALFGSSSATSLELQARSDRLHARIILEKQLPDKGDMPKPGIDNTTTGRK
jgi:tetratricopeptide (TPR) repeat protein